MTYEQQVALWGLLTVVPFALNMATKRHPDAIGLSGMIVMIWAVERVLWTLWTPPECMSAYPAIDFMAGVTAFVAWSTHRARYKLILAGLYVLQLMAATDFWWAWAFDHSSANTWRYVALNNGVYLLELLCVAWPGGSYAAHSIFSRLSHWARADYSAGR